MRVSLITVTSSGMGKVRTTQSAISSAVSAAPSGTISFASSSSSEVVRLALLEAMGKPRGLPRSLDTYLAKVYKYETLAKSVAQTDKGATIRKSTMAVLEEVSTAGATVMLSDDPTREEAEPQPRRRVALHGAVRGDVATNVSAARGTSPRLTPVGSTDRCREEAR